MSDIILDWALARVAYHRLCGKAPSFVGITPPRAPDDRKYIMVPVTQELAKYMKAVEYSNSRLSPEDDVRQPQTAGYVVLMLDSEISDEDLADKSAEEIIGMEIPTSTLSEYRLFSEIYFLMHSCYPDPDERNWTLCPDSRRSDGPYTWSASWSGGQFCISGHRALYHNPNLRARRVWV